MRSTKDVFVHFDDVCRSIFKLAAIEANRPSAKQELALLRQVELVSQPGSVVDDHPEEENGYASHIALGMAKIKANG